MKNIISFLKVAMTTLLLVSSFFVPYSLMAANPGDVLINEFVSNSTTEWVELLNTTGGPIDLTGWSLKELTTPSTTPVEDNLFSLSGILPALGILAFDTGGAQLNNAGDAVILYDNISTTTPIDSVSFGNVVAPYTPADVVAPGAEQSAFYGNGVWSITSSTTKGLANLSQTITVTTSAPASAVYNTGFSVEATASSGLPVAISATGGCSGSGTTSTTITMTSGTTACDVHYNQAGNGSYTPAPEVIETVTAVKANPVLSLDTPSVIYNGADQATGVSGSVAGVASNILYNATSTLPRNAGTYTVTADYAPTDTSNYNNLTSASAGNFVITPRDINVTADSQTKVYGDADPALTYTTDPLFVPDVFTGALSRTAGTNVGAYSITIGTLSAGSNYNLILNSVNLTITARPLTVTAQTNTKAYDGTTSSSATPVLTLGTLVGTDSVTWTQTYDNENVGTGKILTPAGTVNDGNGGNNYSVTFVPDNTGVITAIPLTVTAAYNSKVYDGTTSATAIPTVTGTIAPGDTPNFIEVYNTKNIGAGKSLIPSGTVNDGNGGANYTYTFVNSTNGVITAKELTISGLSAANKTYDATTSASVSGIISLNGVVGVEDVAISGTPVGTFVTPNVGTNNVTVSGLSLTGTDSGNYTLTQPTLSATISAAPLTITAQPNTKVYDGDVTASALPIVSGLLGSDTATGLAETYDTKHVGTAKTLSVSAYTINDGNGGANYSVSTVADTTGVIAERAITVTASANTKTYDGNTSAAALPTVTSGSLAAGDSENFTETYDTEDVGTGKTMTPAGTVNDGNGGANYTYTFVNSTNGEITPFNLTITGTVGNSKVYDSTTAASADFSGASLVGVIGADDVTIDSSLYSASFNNQHVGTGKPITITGVALAGADAGNYTVSQPTGVTGDITVRPLTITASQEVRNYDGTINSGELPVVTSGTLQGTDTEAFAQVFNSKHAGTGKILTPSGVVNDGNGGANYSYTFVNDVTGEIIPKDINVTAQTDTKVYDGTTSSSVVPIVDPLETGDTVGTAPIQTYDTANVGTGKTLTPSGLVISDGNGGANYSVSYVNNTTGVITALDITGSFTADNKVYDGNTTATILTRTPNGVLAVDDGNVTLVGGTASFDTANVGTGKTVTALGMTLGGSAAGNYNLTGVNTATANITPLSITITPTVGQDKVYGTSDPVFTYTNTPSLIGADVFTGALARVAGENVGTYAYTIGTLSAGSNYSLVLDEDSFEIVKANPVITWNNPASILSGTALSGAQLNATTTIAGTFDYSPVSGTVLGVGAHTLSTTFTPTDALNYNTATSSVTLVVTAPASSGGGGGGGGGGGNGAINAVAVAGDVNGDGRVDIIDFNILMTNWGRSGTSNIPGDLNGDRSVDILDFNILMANWK